MTKILVTGGGTAGHISPALAVIEALRKIEPEVQLLYIGSKAGLERQQVEAAGVQFMAISTGKLRRYLSLANLVDQFRIPLGLGQSMGIMLGFRPQVVLATGGYVAVPPVLAAGLLRIPVIIHEQTAQIGLANRINARVAKIIALSWEASRQSLPAAHHNKVYFTGNPIREQIFGGDPDLVEAQFGLGAPELPLVYITGGSLGARVINRAVEEVLPALLEKTRIIHQCGAQENETEQDYDRLMAAAAQLPWHLHGRYAVRKFIGPELKDVYARADLVIGRAGAGTVTELCALGKAALYVPLEPTGGDEQNKNARLAAAAGAAEILPQSQCNGAALLEKVAPLLADLHQLKTMGQHALPLVPLGAADKLAALVMGLAHTSM